MKAFCILAFVFIAACAADTYTADAGINFDKVATSEEEIKLYLECFTGKGDCSAQHAAIKHDVPDMINTACSKCTSQQKHSAKVFFEAANKFYPQVLKELLKNLDPEGTKFPALQTAVASY